MKICGIDNLGPCLAINFFSGIPFAVLFNGNCCLLLLSSLSNPAAIVSSSMEGVMHKDGGTGTIVRLCDRALVDPVLGDDVVPTLTSAKHERSRDSIESERFRNQSLLLQRRLVRWSWIA